MDAKIAQGRTQPLLRIIKDFWERQDDRIEALLQLAAEREESPGEAIGFLEVLASAFGKGRPSLVPILVSWRYTQTVAAFDEAMADALDRTETSQAIEREVFSRLLWQPMYLPLEPMPVYPAEDGEALQPFSGVLVGVLPHSGSSADDPGIDVWKVLVAADAAGVKPFHFSITAENDGHNIAELLDEVPASLGAVVRDLLCHVIQRVIFACSDMPEAVEWRKSAFVAPASAKMKKKVKRFTKFFPPDHPRIAVFGREAGDAIRALEKNATLRAGTGGTVRPHIHRAHWHAYWYGPRDAAGGRRSCTGIFGVCEQARGGLISLRAFPTALPPSASCSRWRATSMRSCRSSPASTGRKKGVMKAASVTTRELKMLA